MSYQVLARKWRPQNFKEMVGQEHVLKALIHALDQQRLHHAYLFTGTRGVGKTTIGRILAKCLNCETQITSEPCGHCDTCREITEGRFVDLIEIDAASRTKVEDMRELLENVQYAPTRGRFKVYLIDEVHMLSQSSFNALLKTLEEPPEHVKFLFATTDPQKLPVTILSRCLQFNLKNMAPERIVGHLKHVLTQEAMQFEESALWLLARAADGSMRDALSLTDQAIAYGNKVVAEHEVSAMLGSIDQKQVYRIIEAVANQDARAVLQEVAALADFSPDYSAVLANIVSVLHRVAIEQVVPGSIDNSMGDQQQIVDLAQALAAEDVQLFYQVGLVGRKDLAISPDQRAGVEMALLRMLAFQPDVKKELPKLKLTPSLPIDDISESEDSGSVSSDTGAPGSLTSEPLTEGSESNATELGQGVIAPVLASTEHSPVAASSPDQAGSSGAEVAEPSGHVVESVLETKPNVSSVMQATERTVNADNAQVNASQSALSPEIAPPDALSSAPPVGYDDLQPPTPEYDEAYLQSQVGHDEDSFESLSGTDSFNTTQKKTVENTQSIDQPAGLGEDDDGNPEKIATVAAIPEIEAEEPLVKKDPSVQQVPSAQEKDEAPSPAIDDITASAFAGKQPGASLPLDQISSNSDPAVTVTEPLSSASLEDYLLMDNPWPIVLPLLELTGMTQNLAANTSVNFSSSSALITAGQGHFRLLTDTHKLRIVDAFKRLFGGEFKVDIEMGVPGVETPAEWIERKKAERLSMAISAIENDTNVQTLVNRFDGAILKSSVEPIG